MTKTESYAQTPSTATYGASGEPVVEPQPAPATVAPQGERLAHFRVDQRIAAGGMGEVFLGFDTSLSRPVAIKTIRAELARDPAFMTRFVREATAQANVVHPHVVQVYFVGQDRGTWFLAMQVVDGGSLHDVIARQQKLRWQDAARHMLHLCEGLVVAERVGIVHRDIKPANILLDKDGRALLSDFGLAASAGAGDAAMPAAAAAGASTGSQLQLGTVTQVGVVMGTPEYVAPEQLRPGPLDARADIYALAASFFHLVTGRSVMPVATLQAAIERYGAGARAPLVGSVAPDVPRAFAAVLDRCLERDPARRFASMAALRDALLAAQPQPELKPSALVRAFAWLLDVAPFVAISYASYARLALLGPALFLVAGAVGAVLLRSTPGIWLMRLRLRTVDDGDVGVGRACARFLVQHGWYLPLALGWSALYAGSDVDVLLVVGAAWLGMVALGSVGALTRGGRALHDVVSGTRVLVDARFR